MLKSTPKKPASYAFSHLSEQAIDRAPIPNTTACLPRCGKCEENSVPKSHEAIENLLIDCDAWYHLYSGTNLQNSLQKKMKK